MAKLIHFTLTAATLLCLAQNGNAAPRPGSLDHDPRSLVKRYEVVYEDCGGEEDDKQKKAARAWSEAANIAAGTIHGVLDDGTAFTDTKA